MPSVVAFNAKGDSIAGLKAARVKSDGEKQVILGPRKNYGIEMIWNASQNNLPKNRCWQWCFFFPNWSELFGFFWFQWPLDLLGPRGGLAGLAEGFPLHEAPPWANLFRSTWSWLKTQRAGSRSSWLRKALRFRKDTWHIPIWIESDWKCFKFQELTVIIRYMIYLICHTYHIICVDLYNSIYIYMSFHFISWFGAIWNPPYPKNLRPRSWYVYYCRVVPVVPVVPSLLKRW